ncbi:hypothetical protein V6U77_02870 [Micromonospora sp. CPCC 205546]|uniref:Uncharacterized protein n=1 Tax=Micromonospora echinofusca TaxID=47858 RepID=A0A1C5GH94_MICEH|nr:hypothetical protein [Micromonospora echinofusca]SCG19160.1 hypothetical protein GA0070610_5524 [Micromonospora echinofusca]
MVDSHNTPARTRPGVVTISTYLLWLFALTQLIGLIITLATVGTISEVLDEAYRGTDANGTQNLADITTMITIGGAVFVLLLAVVLAVLGVFNNKGSNGSRITTWVLGGIMVCCTGGGLVSGLGGGIGTGQTTGDAPSAEEIQRRLDEALPGWFNPVTTLLGVLGLLALLAALILLALPKANEFFRKPKQGWEPPTPGAAYPQSGQPGYPQTGQPGYPPTPGYPSTPGQSSAPDQPGYPPAPGQPQGSDQPGYPPPSAPYGGDQPGSNPGGDQPGPDRPGPTPPPVS